MQAAYFILFWLMIIEVFIFLLLTLPSPTGWKGKITKFFATNQYVKKIMKIQLGLCLLAILFLVDSYKSQQRYLDEKLGIGKATQDTISQMRKGWLSYMILKTQRNKYITFMFLYACLGLTIYVALLNYIYDKRERFELEEKDHKRGMQRINMATPAKPQNNPYSTQHPPSNLSDKKTQ